MIIYDHRVRWVAAVNMAFVVAGMWLALEFGSGASLYVPVVFLGLFSLFWIRDLLFGFRLMLASDGCRLRWQDGKASGSVLLADIRKVLIGTKTDQIGDDVMGWTYVRFALRSGAECDLPSNIASGLRAQSWRRLRQLVTHIRTVSDVPVESIREPGVILEGWKDETSVTTERVA
ncbi:MAG: hypothetical protein AB1705_08890 [Verrucomicrobiota bacterium]